MARLQPDEHAASKILGAVVRFIRDPNGRPIRGIIDNRWISRLEWIALRRGGVQIAAKMVPPPERADREGACPCPGCGRCACAWLADGPEPCAKKTCLCPRRRSAVRLAVRRTDDIRAELVIRRGALVLDCLGVWTHEGGWDFTPAGDAKARSLPKVIARVIGRELEGSSAALEFGPALGAA